jgi:hypothetical protein
VYHYAYVDLQQNDIAPVDGVDTQSITIALRVITIALIILHAVPIVLYSCIFKKFQIFAEMLAGVISFLFYNPTYLITLNTYALCRMDDISWGTKGRDEEQKNQSKLKEKWRKIKFVHVFKFLFWNTCLSFGLISIEDSYLPRLVISIFIMSTIALILFFKLLLGLIYIIKYRCERMAVPRAERMRFGSAITIRLRNEKREETFWQTISTNI